MRIKLALRKEPILAKQAKERQGTRTDLTLPTNVGKVETQPTAQEKKKTERQNSTNHKLAEIAGVSDKTVERYKKIRVKKLPSPRRCI